MMRDREQLDAFFALAAELELLVLVRAGPYMCSEWDLGGLPAWLLHHSPPVTELRTDSEPYISIVQSWFSVILPRLKPHLFINGGSVVMVQVENEYGSFGDVMQSPMDRSYIEKLVAQFRRELGAEVVLYTTDGGSVTDIQRGSLNGSAVYSVGDWGAGTEAQATADATSSFTAMKAYNAPGMSPNLVTEFYPSSDGGWAVVHWGSKFPTVIGNDTVASTKVVMGMGHGSFVYYMGAGGTNTGWWSGSNCVMSATPGWPTCNETTPPQWDITSYDMVAPISESGQHGVGAHGEDLYAQIQQLLGPLRGGQLRPEPPPLPRVAYGPVAIAESLALLDPDVLAALTSAVASGAEPPLMEAVPCLHGMALYTASVPAPTKAHRTISAVVKDRATVFLDGVQQPLALLRGFNTSMALAPPTAPGSASARSVSLWPSRGRQLVILHCHSLLLAVIP
jgi:beta-galactosidase